MDSPIIILVFWVIINILLKSSKDKKKAEQARRKTGQTGPQRGQKPKAERSRMNTGMKDFRKALEDYKAQIEKELNPEKKAPAKAPEKAPEKVPVAEARQRVERPISRPEKPRIKTHREGRYWEDVIEDSTEASSKEEAKEITVALELESKKVKKSSQGLFDIKDDILKGIVYSEILGKPKSMQRKRGPY
jgi:Sec-independent protein translocase protein TatA